MKVVYTLSLSMQVRKTERVFNKDSYLSKLVSASPDSVLITDTKAEIVYVNPAWEKMTGYKFEEVEGKNPRFLQSGKTPKAVHRKLWKNLVMGKPFFTDEVVDRKKSGAHYQTYSTYFPIKKGRKNLFYVQIQHDVTKQKLTEQRRKDFLSMASHEIKTPITTLKLLSQTIFKRVKSKVNLSEVKIFERELDRLTNLVNQMLNLAQLETGKMHLNLEQIELVELFGEVIKKMEFLLEGRKIIFDSQETVTILGDRYRLEQVLINLINNAIKYSEENTSITIGATKENDRVIVSVSDQGKGIEKDKLHRLFEKYYQVDPKNIGFGLGLYISKRIIAKHRGKIWAESKLGMGSTFYFSLPLNY